ncbi:MAG: SAM-dependent methyltransferase [Candidatus Omnitrophota bacterium]|jgi:SAM-dependent methyltransferase
MVVSMDYSIAVEANYASNGNKDNVLIVQGDVYHMPFQENFFDKLFCIGVLQHVPDVKKAFAQLPLFLKGGGRITVDFYRIFPFFHQILLTKFWVRPITRKFKPEVLYKLVHNYVSFMWPICRFINKFIPYGRQINWMLLVADYRGRYDLKDEILRDWAILDSFDMLAPMYDSPQTLVSVREFFKENNLTDSDIHYGYNGIEGRGIKDFNV